MALRGEPYHPSPIGGFMDKVILNVDKDGNAEIKEGKDSLVGKILASKGKVRINHPRVRQEVEIVEKLPEKKPAKKTTRKKKKE